MCKTKVTSTSNEVTATSQQIRVLVGQKHKTGSCPKLDRSPHSLEGGGAKMWEFSKLKIVHGNLWELMGINSQGINIAEGYFTERLIHSNSSSQNVYFIQQKNER